MRPVFTAAGAAVRHRRTQSLVVGVVLLLSTATAVLAVGLLVVSNAPFDQAFKRQSGAHATALFDSRAAGAAVAATARRDGVSAAAGPFDAVTAGLYPTAAGPPPRMTGGFTIVGREDPGGPVDRPTLDSGRWVTGPGEIVLARGRIGPPGADLESMTVDVPGQPSLRVVGVAHSITRSADAWVWPTQSDVLHAAGAPAQRQMLYRFDSAGSNTAVRNGLTAATTGLPRGALTGWTSYLSVKRAADGNTGPMVPFVVAFALLGLVMSALIVANVVSGAVVAGYRTIGVIKSLGFTPGQVIAVYAAQVLIPGLAGCLLGLLLGHLLALPVLGDTQLAYDVAASATLPLWVDLAAGLALTAVVAAASVAPAWRAGRFPAVHAISVGRAPRSGRGVRARRWLASAPLPRPVGLGLGTPFARPARAMATLLAVLIGAVTVVFAVGLAISLNRVTTAFGRTDAVAVEVRVDGPSADAVRSIVNARPGTAHVAGVWSNDVQLPGLDDAAVFIGYDTQATWTGYRLISGRWFGAPDEVMASSHLLRVTGHRVGDTLTFSTDSGRRTVRIVGEIFDNSNGGFGLVGSSAGLGGEPGQLEVALTPGTSPKSYAAGLSGALRGQRADALVRGEENETILIMLSLVTTLALILSAVAALGVFNTVILNTRERAHEIGVLRTLGMTPRQVRLMVIATVAGIGLLAGALAVPLGMVLHRMIIPVMANAADTGIPDSILDVYPLWTPPALGTGGILLAVLGALIPAGWASKTLIATALRAE